MSNPVGPVTQGGVYGRENPPTGHRCGRCSNPFTSSGGNDACPNNRASQVIPYMDEVPDDEL